ncbi:hypothetical protein [Actinokineospora cianjurensis]|uniref:PH (Pleckstrin Homology) domain-containing protein n=1 Tax=Actinokineospora cianjurensis TaxID=585224 RepID=A0A421B3K3_9PSEU|nr:hypothetical protein [Actinokineospora cianjurensis]RLK58905.1 hypothetical protein CLV68_3386 [Actinokineospora cianjurensis]
MRAVRSVWIWAAVACAAAFGLLGVVMVTYGDEIVLGVVAVGLGIAGVVAAMRSGVRVDESGVRERPFFGGGEFVAREDVAGVEERANVGSVLPSKVVVIVRCSGEEVALTSLAYYFGTPRRVRRLRATIEGWR